MRILALSLIVLLLSAPVWAQKDSFPVTAKVESSGTETVPGTGGVTEVKTPPAVRQQFPNAPASSTKRVPPESYISTTATIGDRVYTLRGNTLIDPGDYPASVDGRTVRLLVNDKHGNPKIVKLHVLAVAAANQKPSSN